VEGNARAGDLMIALVCLIIISSNIVLDNVSNIILIESETTVWCMILKAATNQLLQVGPKTIQLNAHCSHVLHCLFQQLWFTFDNNLGQTNRLEHMQTTTTTTTTTRNCQNDTYDANSSHKQEKKKIVI
jgi:hypothetical protein